MRFRLLIALLLSISSLNISWGQVPLSKIEMKIDFQKRFYDNGDLITNNSYVYTDSMYVYQEADLIDMGKSPHAFDKHKHGKWVEYFDRNWKATNDSSNYFYYSLSEYEVGLTKGNCFFFDKKDRLHHMTMRYPPYLGEVFQGYRIIWFNNKEKVKSIQYERFVSELNEEYVNRTTYFSNGNIETYTLRDSESANYHIIEYNKKGQITYELVANNNEQYKSKRKCFGRVEIRESREEGVSYKSKLVKGKLKWKKETL